MPSLIQPSACPSLTRSSRVADRRHKFVRLSGLVPQCPVPVGSLAPASAAPVRVLVRSVRLAPALALFHHRFHKFCSTACSCALLRDGWAGCSACSPTTAACVDPPAHSADGMQSLLGGRRAGMHQRHWCSGAGPCTVACGGTQTCYYHCLALAPLWPRSVGSSGMGFRVSSSRATLTSLMLRFVR